MWDGQQHFFTVLFGPPWLRAQRNAREADQHELMCAKVVKANLDVGDQFLNFKIHESMRVESGVDVRVIRYWILGMRCGNRQDRELVNGGKGTGWDSGTLHTAVSSGRFVSSWRFTRTGGYS